MALKNILIPFTFFMYCLDILNSLSLYTTLYTTAPWLCGVNCACQTLLNKHGGALRDSSQDITER